jgi:hypothetical protein
MIDSGDEVYGDDVTSGLDRDIVHEPIRLSGGAPHAWCQSCGYAHRIDDPDCIDAEEDWSCVDCGIPLEPGAPLICEECAR